MDSYVITQDETFNAIQVPMDEPVSKEVNEEQDSNDNQAITLTAIAGNRQAILSWTVSAGVTWHNVWFGTSQDNLTWLEGTPDTQFTASQLKQW